MLKRTALALALAVFFIPTNILSAASNGPLEGAWQVMSPEQVKGETADARSDVWAFGCVLFEMLTGRPAFGATTTSEILASVLKTEPDWRQLPPDTPQSVRRLLRRCLEKNESNRLRAIADARLEIDEAQQGRDPAPLRTPTQSRTQWLVWASVVALLGAAVLVLGVWSSRRLPAPPEVRFDIITPEVADPIFLPAVALSPDGRQILFVADSDGQPQVWLRAINSVSARPLAGTGGAFFPFWSPDGRSIAFYADGFLKRLDLDGGLVRILAKSVAGVGGTWSRDGVILFVRNPASAIARVSAEGGPAVNATRLDTGQVGHTFPHFLPDGRHFLYYVAGAQDSRGIHVGQIDGSSSRRLLDADAGGVYTNGHLLFIRQTNVFAQEFDAERIELKGSPFQVADGAFRGFNSMLSANAGAFAFRAGAARFVRQFTWVDRSGNQIATVGDRLGNPDGVSYSPDHSQLVFFERGATSSQLWMLDIRRGLVSRFTDDADENIFPVWARDGNRIIYSAVRNGQVSLYQRPIGAGERELLVQTQTEETFASDTSSDGRYIVYQRMSTQVTNETGTYNFASLQPGAYSFSAVLPGFQTQTFQNVTLSQSQQVRLNFTLEVAASRTTVEVVTDMNVSLATSSASVGDLLPKAEVQSLPVPVRDVLQLISSTAGTGAERSFAGQGIRAVNFSRDGIVINDTRYGVGSDFQGQNATYVSSDLVEEVQVVTAAADAEAAGGSAQVRLQTRSGTNQYHGALFLANNNSALNANDWFNNQKGAPKSYVNQNQYGGRLGGPIIKNRAFFFVLIDNQKYIAKQTTNSIVFTDLARQGIFRYSPGRRNANAQAASPSVDYSGNPLFPITSFNLFTDVNDPYRTGMLVPL